MGDKSPKSKRRAQEQKGAVKAKQAERAKVKTAPKQPPLQLISKGKA
ncbi:MAG: hypothetical protein OEZ06_00645 [Myxococcales bacterium]|nr:hypothetical protein [Myxococcales bacterium]